MADSKSTVKNLLDQVTDELKADKKKVVVVGVLLVVACVVAGKLLLKPSSPARASGASSGAPSLSSQLSEPQTTRAYTNAGTSASDHAERASIRDEYLSELKQRIRRDLFTPNPDFFPIEADESTNKILPNPGDQSAEQRRLVEAEAALLAVQSTMISSNPTVIINGRVLPVGGRIDGFEVTAITPRTCTVCKNGVTVVLKMSKGDSALPLTPRRRRRRKR